MLFEVIGPDKQGKMCTDYAELVPWDKINDMAKFGYSFKWDGKAISKSALLAKLPETQKCATRSPDKESSSYTTGAHGIICVETGKIYNKQSEAAKDLGIDPAQVSDSIKTGRPRSGYTFKKVQ